MWSINWTYVLGALILTGQIGLRLVALGVIPGGRRPSTGMAWLLLILVEPFIGFAIFLLFGRTNVGKKREASQQIAQAAIDEVEHDETIRAASVDPAQVASGHVVTAVHLNRQLGAAPLVGGNDLTLLEDYTGTIAAMTAEIERAQAFVHVEFYISAWDEVTEGFFTAMADAAERGVRVLFLFDHIGSRGIPGYKSLIARLERTKIQWRPMLPIQPLRGHWRRPDLRNHRKLLVVDGTVGFTGSLNLTEPGYNKPANHRAGREWVELMVRIEGPVVSALNDVFAADWYVETHEIPDLPTPPAGDPSSGVPCQLVPSGPGYESENNLRLFTTLIYSAQRRISLTSPYFVPDESMLYAVTTAAQRGIEIELFVSEESDQFLVGHAQASYYDALLAAGVRIYAYPAPAILHAKHFTIDDDVAVIGSSNMDMRSFSLNYEISMMMLGTEIVDKMRVVEDHYRAISKEITREQWAKRRATTRYVDNVCRLTAALQ